MVLEAVDYLYSLMVPAHTDWKDDLKSTESWQEVFATLPGKLLGEEKILNVTHMYPGSAIEILQGLAGPVEKLIEFLALYREKKRLAQIQALEKSLEIITKQLMQVLAKMQKNGVPQENIKRTIAKAHYHMDQVLDALMSQNKVAIVNVSSEALPGYKCPVCGAASAG
jgi:DNA repair exonuclease SbcCD ATPase subunit